jgi:hypothetical protein
LVRFEDLVTESRKTALQLCRDLEVDFDEVMLRQRVYVSSYRAGDAPVEGFDVTAVDRWRSLLHPVLNRCFVTVCGRHLQEYGYEP